MTAWTSSAAAFRLQLSVLRRSPGDLLVLVITPMMTFVFLSIFESSGRRDVATYAVLAPALMALWQMALWVAGEIIERDKGYGVFELLLAAPASLLVVNFGRVAAVTLLSMLAFGESWLVARIVFGIHLSVPHLGLFTIVLFVTAVATMGWALAVSGAFAFARSARVFQNALTYPVYILGGVLVPVDLLPHWIRPVTNLVYLSWASDLLRACTLPEPVPDPLTKIGIVCALALLGFFTGSRILRLVVTRMLITGTVTRA